MFSILSKLVKLVQTQLMREETCWAPAVQDAGAQVGHVTGMALLAPWNLWKPKIPRAAVANCSAKIGARIPDSADLNNSALPVWILWPNTLVSLGSSSSMSLCARLEKHLGPGDRRRRRKRREIPAREVPGYCSTQLAPPCSGTWTRCIVNAN